MDGVRRVVLFCDISGFMRLSGSLGSAMPGFLQAFYELVGNTVVERGGTLIKYLGDAVLSVFPGGREPDAVKCAIRLRHDFAVLVHTHAPGDAARLEAAISSGEVVQGTFGHSSLRTEDILGEAVAQASVLNRVPGIVVTEAVKNALGGTFLTKQLPPLPVKWGAQPIQAWQIIEERQVSSQDQL
jgi:adenylate cyclase